MGPLKTAQGGYTFIFVAIDKFTKWIEVKPVTTTTVAKAAEFIQEITYRFGILGLLPGKLHQCVLRLCGPPDVQRPGGTR